MVIIIKMHTSLKNYDLSRYKCDICSYIQLIITLMRNRTFKKKFNIIEISSTASFTNYYKKRILKRVVHFLILFLHRLYVRAYVYVI